MFNMALMSLTPQHLSFSLKNDLSYKHDKTEPFAQRKLEFNMMEGARDSIIERPPQVTKMSYCSSTAKKLPPRKRDLKLFRKAASNEIPKL